MVDGEVVINDRMQSEGEWQLMAAGNGRFRLQHILSGNYITAEEKRPQRNFAPIRSNRAGLRASIQTASVAAELV